MFHSQPITRSNLKALRADDGHEPSLKGPPWVVCGWYVRIKGYATMMDVMDEDDYFGLFTFTLTPNFSFFTIMSVHSQPPSHNTIIGIEKTPIVPSIRIEPLK